MLCYRKNWKKLIEENLLRRFFSSFKNIEAVKFLNYELNANFLNKIKLDRFSLKLKVKKDQTK